MRIIRFFLLLVAILVSSTSAYDVYNPTKCSHCFQLPYDPVCGKATGTYWNTCELECEKGELKHEGECNSQDLLENDHNGH